MHTTFRVFIAAVVRNTVGLVFHGIRQKQKTQPMATPVVRKKSSKKKVVRKKAVKAEPVLAKKKITRRSSKHKKHNHTPLTKKQELLVVKMFKDRLRHNKNRPRKERITLQEWADLLNLELDTDKSVSTYARIVNKYLPDHGYKK